MKVVCTGLKKELKKMTSNVEDQELKFKLAHVNMKYNDRC